MTNYDPKDIAFMFHGFLITGYAGDTFLTVERGEDSFTDKVGADGEVVRTRKHDKRATITVTLAAESPSNDILAAALAADELSGRNTGASSVTNFNSNGTLTAPESWVVKQATAEFGAESGEREWTIRCSKLEGVLGGAVS